MIEERLLFIICWAIWIPRYYSSRWQSSMGPPSDVCWFINHEISAMKTSSLYHVISTINHRIQTQTKGNGSRELDWVFPSCRNTWLFNFNKESTFMLVDLFVVNICLWTHWTCHVSSQVLSGDFPAMGLMTRSRVLMELTGLMRPSHNLPIWLVGGITMG